MRACSPRDPRSSVWTAGLVFLVPLLAGGCGETGFSSAVPAAEIVAMTPEPLRGHAGSPLPEPVRVRVLGAEGTSLPGAVVHFRPENGVMEPANAVTDEQGIASARWTLGEVAGESRLSVEADPDAALTLAAVVMPAEPAAARVLSSTTLAAPAGSPVSERLVVEVADVFGNPTPDVEVTYSIGSGGGQVHGARQRTGTDGTAHPDAWILGRELGVQTLVAHVEAPALADEDMVITATAVLGADATLQAVAGDRQEAPVGTAVAIPPRVVVRTAEGHGVAGVRVEFQVTGGGGRVMGAVQETGGAGSAGVESWLLGEDPGENRLEARADGLGSLVFTATGGPGAPVELQPASAVSQTAPIGSPVAQPPAVRVRDAHGLAVPGVSVVFDVVEGGGTVSGSPARTDAAGIARLDAWRLGLLPGRNAVVATAEGLAVATFVATGEVGAPARVVPVAGMDQVAVRGEAVPVAPAVRVSDVHGAPVPGVGIVFGVTRGGGSATGLVRTTDAGGVAAVDRWVLGAGAPNVLAATVAAPGVAGSPVEFRARAASAVAVGDVPRSIKRKDTLSVSARLVDAEGKPVSLAGVALTLEIASGEGRLEGTLTRFTDAAGAVAFTGISMRGKDGERTLRVKGAGLDSATTTTIEVKK